MKTTEKNSKEKTTAKKSASTEKKAADTKTAKKPATRKRTIKAKSSAAEKLRELFVDALKDIYWAEKALTKALPLMEKNATAPQLVKGLNDHLAETENHVDRLEQVFKHMDEKAVAKKCDAMEGLIKEGKSILEETELGPVRDAGIIAAAQKIEHYEIATYGTLVAWAQTLGEDEVADLLEETLKEEKNADEVLSEAAFDDINFEALDSEGEKEESKT